MDYKPGYRQLLICRKEYIRLEREVKQQGISLEAVETCQKTLVNFQNGRWFLKPIAFLPTGVALGCPLPEKRTQKLFYRVAELTEKWFQSTGDVTFPSFAYVPPQSYHITIVNRSHYEFNDVVPLTGDEKRTFEKAILKLNIRKISVVTQGLFLTHTGRLFIKCLALDDEILNLRSFLAESFPQLQTNVPRLVHIKIGHLMKALNKKELVEFYAWLERLGHYTISRLDFSDLYTPVGRIEL